MCMARMSINLLDLVDRPEMTSRVEHAAAISEQGLVHDRHGRYGASSCDDQLPQALQAVEDALRGSSAEGDARRGDVERVGFGVERGVYAQRDGAHVAAFQFAAQRRGNPLGEELRRTPQSGFAADGNSVCGVTWNSPSRRLPTGAWVQCRRGFGADTQVARREKDERQKQFFHIRGVVVCLRFWVSRYCRSTPDQIPYPSSVRWVPSVVYRAFSRGHPSVRGLGRASRSPVPHTTP